MTDVSTSEVEKLVAEWRAADRGSRFVRDCAAQLAAAIQQDKDRAGDACHDTIALEVARQFTPDTDPQRRASLQCAVIDALRRGSRPAQPAEVDAGRWRKLMQHTQGGSLMIAGQWLNGDEPVTEWAATVDRLPDKKESP